MSAKRKDSIIEYLLEREGIVLPSAIFKLEMVEELERALSTQNPYAVSSFYRERAKRLAEDIEVQRLKELFHCVQKFSKKCNYDLPEDDRKIINFLVRTAVLPANDFIEMLGPLYYLLSAMESLERENISSPSLRMFILTSAYVQLYELILYQVDRRLYHYITARGLDKRKEFKRFLDVNRESPMEHAMASQINYVLSKISEVELSLENNSIFRNSWIRNRIAHANLFYDDLTNTVIVGDKRYTVEEFLREYCHLMTFALEWLRLSAKVPEGEDITETVISRIRSTFYQLSKIFLMIGRDYRYRRTFGAMVIQWKRKMQS